MEIKEKAFVRVSLSKVGHSSGDHFLRSREATSLRKTKPASLRELPQLLKMSSL